MLYAFSENVAQGKPATQSGVSTVHNYARAEKAVDGDKSTRTLTGRSCIYADTTNGYSGSSDDSAWWQVDLGQEYEVHEVKITTVTAYSRAQGIRPFKIDCMFCVNGCIA